VPRSDVRRIQLNCFRIAVIVASGNDRNSAVDAIKNDVHVFFVVFDNAALKTEAVLGEDTNCFSFQLVGENSTYRHFEIDFCEHFFLIHFELKKIIVVGTKEKQERVRFEKRNKRQKEARQKKKKKKREKKIRQKLK
jgi:hypothetical protein